MDYYLILYILFSIVVLTSGSYIFVKENKMIATAVFFIGAMAVLVFYGLRWFKGDKAKSLGYDGSWPPANRLNFCPDYFTMKPAPTNSDGIKFYCVDTVGFAKQNLGKFVEGTSTISAITAIGDYSSGNSSNNRKNAIADKALNTLDNKCAICKDLGITWEGVYDGQSCINRTKGVFDSSGVPTSCPTT